MQEKSKVNKLDLELQELKASVHHMKEEWQQERDALDDEIGAKEKEMMEEIEEVKKDATSERKENEKNIER